MSQDAPLAASLALPGLKNSIASARLPATGEKLNVVMNADGAVLSVPPAAPDKISSTIVLKTKGEFKN